MCSDTNCVHSERIPRQNLKSNVSKCAVVSVLPEKDLANDFAWFRKKKVCQKLMTKMHSPLCDQECQGKSPVAEIHRNGLAGR